MPSATPLPLLPLLHAYAARRPYAELEIRQDRLGDAGAQALWAGRLAELLRGVAGHG